MTIPIVSGLTGVQQQQSIREATSRLQSAIAELVSANRLTTAPSDIAALSAAARLQAQNSGLRQVSANLSHAFSLTQVADAGLEQIQDVLGELQSIASQANAPILNENDRSLLDEQFQNFLRQIDSIAKSTSFNSINLLNGSIDGENALSLDNLLTSKGEEGRPVGLSIADLTNKALFKGRELNVLSTESAVESFTAISDALSKLIGIRSDVGSFQLTLEFASASITSAIVNQEAARAELSDTDLAAQSTELSLADLKENAAIALTAQGNRLTPSLLKLVN